MIVVIGDNVTGSTNTCREEKLNISSMLAKHDYIAQVFWLERIDAE